MCLRRLKAKLLVKFAFCPIWENVNLECKNLAAYSWSEKESDFVNFSFRHQSCQFEVHFCAQNLDSSQNIISVENHFWSSVVPSKATGLLQRFFHPCLDTHTEENNKINTLYSKHIIFYILSFLTDVGPDLPGNNPCERPPAFVRP